MSDDTRAAETPDSPPEPDRFGKFLLAVIIVLLSAALYAPTLSFEFLEWDDPLYVTHNPRVTEGLSVDGLR